VRETFSDSTEPITFPDDVLCKKAKAEEAIGTIKEVRKTEVN
jgi:hypothetical protein